MSVVIPIPSIIIPSDEMICKKTVTVYGGVSPIEEDKSTWSTVVYDFWHIQWVVKDITDRLDKLELTPLDEVDNEIANIKEGMSLLFDKLAVSTCYNGMMKRLIPENNRIILAFREAQIAKKRKEIDDKKDKIIKRMEKFRQDLETRQVKTEEIDKEKKEIQKDISDIRNMGAEKECLRQIGKILKTVYTEISKFINSV